MRLISATERDTVDASDIKISGIRRVRPGEEAEVVFTYRSGENPVRFVARWYTSTSNLQNGIEIDEDAAPTIVSWSPETPVDVPGTHIGVLTYSTNEVGSTYLLIEIEGDD